MQQDNAKQRDRAALPGTHPVRLAGLGYVGVETPDVEAWRSFGAEVCGFVACSDTAGASLRWKLDRRQWRLSVHEAETPGLGYLGFESPSVPDFDRAVDAIAARGVAVEPAPADLCAARGVARLAVLHDPAGHRIELFQGAIAADEFRSPKGIEFLTGALGMGHAVLYVPEIEEALAFYRDVLGFARSDYMNFGPGGMGIHFLRCTPRHHSVALLQVGAPSGVQHLMFEATTLDAVGKALDRALAAGVPITSSLGRHRNDRTVSFYMRGPSGFDVEIGWDGLIVGDDWVEHEFAGGGDEWGHRGLTAESLKPGA